MYKTAVITDEISQDLREACALAARFSLDGVEIRTVEEKNPFQMSPTDVHRVKKICDDYGLSICGIASPFFKCNIEDEQGIRAHLEGLKRCAEAAHIWGTDLVRGFTFWYTEPCDWQRVAGYFEPVMEIAQQEQLRIAIESEPSVNTKNMRTLYEFLKLLSCPRIGALFDAGNEVTDLHCPPPYPTGYELLKPYIMHIHVKDIKGSPRGTENYSTAMLGEGDVDYDGLFRQIKADGFNQWVSVETHYRIIAEKLSNEELTRPGGSAFSKGGYAATEAYLKVLQDRYHWQQA